ncbi:MAG: sugar ABC transporter substrate-binding protein [Clostridiales bacterium]|nr:sugar ABC transporter substrate-binding protein [Clostridiales bacterium]
MKKFLALILAVVMAFSLMACGSKGNEAGGTNSAESDSSKKLTIGFNNYLKGIYSLDILEKNFNTACEALGVEPMVVNDEGKTENCVTNVDNMIAAGVDGIVFFGISDTLFPVIAQKCEAAGVAYAFFDHMPSQDVFDSLKNNANFAGCAGTVDTNTGKNIGTYAGEQGLKKALIVSGLTTDVTHSARTNGFEEAFKAAGGEVLAEGYGEVTISEALTRANDLLTAHPEADCIYATNGDVGTACMEALAKHPEVKAQLFVTDLDPDVLTGLENGSVAAANGAHWVNIDYATALLVNFLNGNPIKEADGSAARLIVPVMTLPSSYVKLYNAQWIENSPYSDEEIQSLVSPFNKSADLSAFQAMLDAYTIDNRLQAKVDAGVITQADYDAVKTAK